MHCAKLLRDMGYELFATKNTHEALKAHGGIESSLVFKPLVKREPNAFTMLKNSKLDLVINVPDSMDSQALTDGFEMRRAAIDSGTPLITDIKVAVLMAMSLHRKWTREREGRAFWSFESWQEYTEPREVL